MALHGRPIARVNDVDLLMSAGDAEAFLRSALQEVTATQARAEILIEEFAGAARMLGAVLRNTTNPTVTPIGASTSRVSVAPQIDTRLSLALRMRMGLVIPPSAFGRDVQSR